MLTFLVFIHIFVAILLILVVLMQQPQKGGITSVFGGGESIFGGGGAAPFMTKLTSGLAIIFMITSLSLVILSARRIRPPAPVSPRPAPEEQVPTPTTPSPLEETPETPEGGK